MKYILSNNDQDDLYERAVELEKELLLLSYSEIAIFFNNKFITKQKPNARQELIELYDDAVGNINDTDQERHEALISKAVLTNDKDSLMKVMTQLFMDSIEREAIRNIDMNAVDTGD
jgi:hypothetical protein